MPILPEKKSRLLLIENDPVHYKQIQRKLEERGYGVERMTSWQPAELYNYKALHGENQIMIVDYNLGATPGDREGRALIRKDLWEVDRSGIFIVFSSFVHEEYAPQPVDLESLQPYRVFVPKLLDDEAATIAEGSLDALVRVVDECHKIAVPVLEAPRHDTYHTALPFETYLDKHYATRDSGYPERVRKQMVDSATVLTRLTGTATHYARAGLYASRLGVGVYGSCGRLEKREDSDVEFSLFYDPDGLEPGNEEVLLQLAVTCWNRMAYFCRANRWKFEWERRIMENSPPILLVDDVQYRLENRYLPVINAWTLSNEDLQRNASARNRFFQVLTELRPVFNSELFFGLKRNLITRNGTIAPHLGTLAGNQHLQNIFNQFEMDAGPETLTTYPDLKRYCYRLVNLLACRITLIRKLRFDDLDIDNDTKWQYLFDALSEPGIVKIARLANRLLGDGKGKKKHLANAVKPVMSSYLELLSRFGTFQAPTNDGTLDVAEQAVINALRILGHQMREQFVTLFEVLEKEDGFDDAVKRAPWLFNTERLRTLVI